MKCHQCNNQAIYKVNKIPLCLNCYEKLHKIQEEEYWRLVNESNHLLEAMEITSGVPIGTLGRQKIPSTNQINNTVNTTINIDKSVVGTINTGYANEIYSNLETINQTISNEEILFILKEFIEAFSKSDDIETQIKTELLEQISFLTEELKKDKNSRKFSMIKSVIGSISSSISTVDSLLRLFEPISKYFLS